MKFIILLLSFVLYSCDTTEPSESSEHTKEVCPPLELGENAVAYYPFSESSLEDQINDYTFINHNEAEPTRGHKGVDNCAYRFNSEKENFLILLNPFFLNKQAEYSISLWYKHEKNNEGVYEILFTRGSKFNREPEKSKYMTLGIGSNNSVNFRDFTDIWDTNIGKKTYVENELNVWYHLVATCRYNINTVSLYQNGRFVTSSKAFPYKNYEPLDIGDLIIGKNFNGVIDDVIIYDKELTGYEVTKLYDSQK